LYARDWYRELYPEFWVKYSYISNFASPWRSWRFWRIERKPCVTLISLSKSSGSMSFLSNFGTATMNPLWIVRDTFQFDHAYLLLYL
jgi:hypothetical protein